MKEPAGGDFTLFEHRTVAILYFTTGNEVCMLGHTFDLSTARPKWRLDGLVLSGSLLYSLFDA